MNGNQFRGLHINDLDGGNIQVFGTKVRIPAENGHHSDGKKATIPA